MFGIKATIDPGVWVDQVSPGTEKFQILQVSPSDWYESTNVIMF